MHAVAAFFAGILAFVSGLFSPTIAVNPPINAPVTQPAAVAAAQSEIAGNPFTDPEAATTVAATIPPTAPVPAFSPPPQQTVINQPVIERIIERIVPQGGTISASTLTAILADFEQTISNRIAALNPPKAAIPEQVAAAGNATGAFFPASQRIDQITNTAINTPTITGGSISGASVSGYLPLSGGTLSGTLSGTDLNLSGMLTAGTLSVTSLSSGGALSAPYFTATSTTATSTFAGSVGIGTTSPRADLHIGGDGQIMVQNGNTLQDRSGDFWMTSNAYFDGTDWRRQNTSKTAFGLDLRGSSVIPNEAEQGAVLWVAQSGANPVNATFGTTGGWEIGWALTATRNFVIGGMGLELDGSGLSPYGRVVHNNSLSTVNTGIAKNIYADFSGRDASAQPSWFAGFVDDAFNVRRLAGSAAISNGNFASLLSIDSSGNVGIGTTTPNAALTVAGSGSSRVNVGGFFGSGYGAISLNGTADTTNYNFLSGNSATDNTLYLNRASGGAVRFREANGTDQLTILTGGNVGIGTTSPWGKLSITGSGTGTGLAFAVADSANTPRFVIQDNGNIGIGTTSPGLSLTVVGNAYMERAGAGALAIVNRTDGVAGAVSAGSSAAGFRFDSAGDFRVQSQPKADIVAANNSNIATMLTITNAGNVGVGNTSPSEKLNVQGTAAFQLFNATSTTGTSTIAAGQGLTIGSSQFVLQQGSGNVGIGTASPARRLHIRADGSYQFRIENGSAGGGYWNIAQADNTFGSGGGKLLFLPDSDTSTNATVVFTNSGNVGIGTTTPGYKLEVRGSGDVLALGGAAAATHKLGFDGVGNPYIDFVNTNKGIFRTGGSDRMIIDSSGNVGIGTTSPQALLGLQGAVGVNNKQMYLFADGRVAFNGDALNSGEAMRWTGQAGGAANTIFDFCDNSSGTRCVSLDPGVTSGVADIYSSWISGSEPKLHLSTYSNRATAAGVTIDTAGNVGIGSTTPNEMLTVNGNVNIAAGKCYMVNGVCIGYVVKLAAIYATTTPSGNSTTTVVFTGAQGSAPSYSANTLTMPSNTSYIVSEVWGGGGGGGGTCSTAGGGGGGGAGYGRNLYASLSTRYYYSVGAGGAGSAGGVGSAGLASFFGTGSATTTANGGGGGGCYSTAVGGGGGTSSGGDINITGNAGGPSFNGVTTGGTGGNAAYSAGGGAGGGPSSSGSNGSAVGAGGGGDGGSGGTGGNGAAGGIVITVYATSSPNAAGNDYAELFPVSNPIINAGDIVAVDSGIPVSMKLAAQGDRALVGVISTQPGQLLGDKDAVGMRPVALAGRVPTKVNMENGPIALGDRIAISSTPGVGMKAGPFDDAVGIALESTDHDGTVMTFVTLSRGIDINAIAMTLLGNDTAVFATSSTATGTAVTSATTGPIDFVGGMMSAIASRIGVLNNAWVEISATSTAASSSPTDVGDLLYQLFASITRWLGDAGNGIGKIFAREIHGDVLCAGATCVNEEQLAALLASVGQPASSPSDPALAAASLAPTLELTGNATSTIEVGAIYNDLGARIVAPESDLNLGIVMLLNGATTTAVTIDTSTPGLHSILYTVTSPTTGLTGSVVRTVIVSPAEQPPAPAEDSNPFNAETAGDTLPDPASTPGTDTL